MTDAQRKQLAIAAVVVSLLAMWSIYHRLGGRTSPSALAHTEQALVCTGCGGASTLDRQSMRQRAEALRHGADAGAASAVKCPSCGAQTRRIEAVVCPSCDRMFILAIEHRRDVSPEEVTRLCPERERHAK
jgi:hypothetical protein